MYTMKPKPKTSLSLLPCPLLVNTMNQVVSFTIYHIIRRTLWPVKGHSSAAKLEGGMKTLVFYIFNGISFNAQDFFIRQLAASGSDIFGLKFYAPWVMRLIKLHSTINYQPSAIISYSCQRLICLSKPYTQSLPRSQFIFTTSIVKVSLNPLKEFVLQLVFILWLEIHMPESASDRLEGGGGE